MSINHTMESKQMKNTTIYVENPNTGKNHGKESKHYTQCVVTSNLTNDRESSPIEPKNNLSNPRSPHPVLWPPLPWIHKPSVCLPESTEGLWSASRTPRKDFTQRLIVSNEEQTPWRWSWKSRHSQAFTILQGSQTLAAESDERLKYWY